ncbi:hypothetical protein CROQUDRAFT_41012 [Cronartium quercuum f. sp. fusiforme G11]|uniref:Uncharacterized protein n=1 Tax=Cronartium quercuum f. sp. fusiforme G11 TaxID=708437 RepID=A0A9P6TDU0_9BASI|nr:hypothetical protein CROQUDRAFT_41012 [Cronartium quercuum f. sp. fusiforme G11]
MIETLHGHFFIYKPIQLLSSQEFELFVPIFFYKDGENSFSKCLKAVLKPNNLKKKYDVYIPSEPDFSSKLLFTINVNQFWHPFSAIQLPNGTALKPLCSS